MNLSEFELDSMREDIESLLPDIGNILSVTTATDGAGGITETWGTLTVGVACRLDAISGKEQLAGGAIEPFHRYVLTLPYSVVITSAHRFEHNSIEYSVISVDSDKSWATCTRAIVERV